MKTRWLGFGSLSLLSIVAALHASGCSDDEPANESTNDASPEGSVESGTVDAGLDSSGGDSNVPCVPADFCPLRSPDRRRRH